VKFLAPLFLLPLGVSSQINKMAWFSYQLGIKLNTRFQIHTDIQYRMDASLKSSTLFALRSGFGYNVKSNFQVRIGIADFRYFVKPQLTSNEWRFWQSAFYTRRFGNASLINRLLLEQRFVQNVKNEVLLSSYQYETRYRYKLDLNYLLNKGKNIALTVSDEIILKTESNSNKYYDQNRLAFGLIAPCMKYFELIPQFLFIHQTINQKARFIYALRLTLNQ
jgi:hypothetical protein